MSTTSAVNISPVSTPPRNRPINLGQDASTTSPSSTTISESGVSTSFHQPDGLAVRTHASAGFLAARKITIRSDPALLTCFDAADKQLYDLWVPRR